MLLRKIFLILTYAALLGGGFWISGVLHDRVEAAELHGFAIGMIASGLLAYVVFSAIPFVPGAEIGLGLLMVMGSSGAVLVYLGMVSALNLAFLAGRYVPVAWVCAFLQSFGLQKAHDLVQKSAELNEEERARFIEKNAPSRLVPFLLRRRYVTLAVLFNMPGNVVLGGGGGIAFAAGACRLFGTWPFVLTTLIAVAPVPLAFLLFGTGGWFIRP